MTTTVLYRVYLVYVTEQCGYEFMILVSYNIASKFIDTAVLIGYLYVTISYIV